MSTPIREEHPQERRPGAHVQARAAPREPSARGTRHAARGRQAGRKALAGNCIHRCWRVVEPTAVNVCVCVSVRVLSCASGRRCPCRAMRWWKSRMPSSWCAAHNEIDPAAGIGNAWQGRRSGSSMNRQCWTISRKVSSCLRHMSTCTTPPKWPPSCPRPPHPPSHTAATIPWRPRVQLE